MAARQGQGRARAQLGGARHRERAAGERRERARPRRGGRRARPPLALEGGRPRGRGGPRGARRGRRQARACASRTSRAPCAGRLPRTQPLALAMIVETPPEGDEWLHEIKHDGYRIVARIEEGEVRLVSRNGEGLDEGVPAGRARRGPAAGGHRCCSTARSPRCCRTGRRASRRSSAAPTAWRRSSTSPSTCCTSTAGTCATCGSTSARRCCGASSNRRPTALRFSDHVRGQGPEFFEKARQAGLEGVVSKRADSPYREGRGGDWRKAKCRLSQEMVIGGWTLPSDGRASIGALHVGFSRGRAARVRGQGRLRLQRAPARRPAPATRGAAAGQLPVRRRPRRDATRRALGRAGPRGPGRVHAVDRRRAGCASRCSSGCATTGTRGTWCASGRARSRAAASTRWRRAGRGRRCASTRRARAPRAATRSSSCSACA